MKAVELKYFLKRLFDEPLVHFFILGSLLYIFYTSTTTQVDTARSITQKRISITISSDEKELLSKKFINYFHHKPSEEIKQLLEKQLYKKKLLLESAYALELYKNDAKVKEILLKKMRYILQADKSSTLPTEATLHEYYLENIIDYSKRKTISFAHIYFENITQEQSNLYFKLIEDSKDSLPAQTSLKQTRKALDKQYGTYFTNKIFHAKKGEWLSIIPTNNGYEFVYILSYQTSSPYDFELVEDRVYADYIKQTKKKQLQQELQRLYKLYPQNKVTQ